MKRAPALILLFALSPFVRAEEPAKKADEVPAAQSTEAESVSAEPAADAASVAAPADEKAPEAVAEPAPASEPAAAAVPAAPASPSQTHKVVKGDTLWALAGAYLKNPFLWPKILDANREKIQNPRLIFPNQEFVIPSVEAADALAAAPAEPAAVEAAPAPAPAPEPETKVPAPAAKPAEAAPAAPIEAVKPPEEPAADVSEEVDDKTQDEREAKKKKTMAVPGAGFMGGVADAFLADENWEYDGYILRDRDQRMMISQGDVVFLNIGAASGVKPKMVADLYRVGKKVKDPYLKKKTGRMVKRVGSVMVTGEITDEGCTAVVTNSLEPIRIGDIVKFATR